MGNAESCGNFDFSYNGLGDNEALLFAKVLTNHFKNKFPPDEVIRWVSRY
jgi:hypothetical protein